MKFHKFITLVLCLFVAGCASTLDMASNFDGMKGSVISSSFTKGAKSRKEGNTVIYEISIEEAKCNVIIAVNAESRIMESWEYHPDSEPCEKVSSYGHAW